MSIRSESVAGSVLGNFSFLGNFSVLASWQIPAGRDRLPGVENLEVACFHINGDANSTKSIRGMILVFDLQ
jgi:hypothetical protein